MFTFSEDIAGTAKTEILSASRRKRPANSGVFVLVRHVGLHWWADVDSVFLSMDNPPPTATTGLHYGPVETILSSRCHPPKISAAKIHEFVSERFTGNQCLWAISNAASAFHAFLRLNQIKPNKMAAIRHVGTPEVLRPVGTPTRRPGCRPALGRARSDSVRHVRQTHSGTG
jgi:hypothetical protein